MSTLQHGRLHRELSLFVLTPPTSSILRHRASAPLTRLLSTSPHSPATPEAPSEPSPPTPIPPTPRKPKVELRPGPVKLSATRTQTTTKPLLSDTSAPSSPEVKASGASVIDAVKEDWRHASTHGIFDPPPPDAGRIGKLWHQAKQYFKFYLNGIKLVNTHRQRAAEIRARVKAGGPPLDRWETRFLAMHRSDLAKLVPFVVIILLLEEVIPLIVLYAPFMLPSTCILPSQRARIETKRRDKQRAFSLEARDELRSIVTSAAKAGSTPLPSGHALVALCGMLSISTMGPSPLRATRVAKHLRAIAADDALLVQEGMGERLTHPELLEALEERGIIVSDPTTSVLKSRLRWWLTHAEKGQDGDEVGRRLVLVARSGLGQF
ncbi:hypothetical protein BV25DRAFT_1801777 [Artomyces pyxidatus]|uniref:Uncharacterized protein n=1 Tax=Artomyces pyxidatus TaxID=48021 RepID=A0ACB8T6D0_9AGAM|nr:hypothetical protein BV25DRAFT_1801777 [Artomyces pyxidatus]